MEPIFLFLSLVLLLCGAATSSRADDDCVYTRTGSIIKGGTDSIIGLKLYDSFGNSIVIGDLERWGGLMDPGHNYFERGNLDIFSGKGACLDGPLCAVNVTSDGSGSFHGWYCNYVEVTSTGARVSCGQQLFTVEQWLATDAWPYKLWASIDHCPYDLREPQARPLPQSS
ncbi:hypothetical protein L6164_012371 [Bauhinia variegata]|uniref:Uncharacterized protein n=1 Tax=Bauhinia variegata TaxID=167791 RepID=A0ACB9PBB6_BAUVA|nr:hypothetical protein L6164_012371 [Bauhinia variegata]